MIPCLLPMMMTMMVIMVVTRLDSVTCFSSSSYSATSFSRSCKPPLDPTRYHQSMIMTIQSSTDDDSMTSNDSTDASSPPPPLPIRANTSPSPPVPPKILDPLMASLTRVDAGTANLGTRTIPIFGEVPADGSLIVLVPAAISAVLGLALSIVIAFNSKDAIVATFSQVSDELSQTAVSRSSQAYDDSICRGICSTQEQDLEGLKTFLNKISSKN
jgi:hypothetical protein